MATILLLRELKPWILNRKNGGNGDKAIAQTVKDALQLEHDERERLRGAQAVLATESGVLYVSETITAIQQTLEDIEVRMDAGEEVQERMVEVLTQISKRESYPYGPGAGGTL